MAAYNKKTIEDVEVSGKTVLVRCDFNVPMKDGVITDENRINGALPTIKYLVDNGVLLLECGIGQAEHIAKILSGCKSVEIIKDYENIDRIVKAVF